MKKLYVDENSCIGCGACVALDDEHFGFNDQGLSTVISTENIDEESIQNSHIGVNSIIGILIMQKK